MTKLSVNVNKLATLRNARGKNNPDLLKTTLDIIAYGAQGITVHPRPDERHIRREDVFTLAEAIDVEFNIEGYPDENFIDLVKSVRPAQCTLVPDSPHVLTSNAGWAIEKNFDLLKNTVTHLHKSGIRTALFVDPFQLTDKDIDLLPLTGTDRVELYTEHYAESFGTGHAESTLQLYVEVAKRINDLGIALNAGHDLDSRNLKPLIQAIPSIEEVSIGHALICESLYLGLQKTIAVYLDCLR
jgi:pyridoxine 5-phosphate synthase